MSTLSVGDVMDEMGVQTAAEIEAKAQAAAKADQRQPLLRRLGDRSLHRYTEDDAARD